MKIWNWTDGLTDEEREKYEYGFRALRPDPCAECFILAMLILTAIVELI